MRVKIYRQGCDVETHEIPQLAGKTVTRDGIDVDGTRVKCGTETESEVDDVADVIERFTFSPERGGFLERFVRRWEYVNGMWRHVDRGANGTRGMVVVAPDEVGVRHANRGRRRPGMARGGGRRAHRRARGTGRAPDGGSGGVTGAARSTPRGLPPG